MLLEAITVSGLAVVLHMVADSLILAGDEYDTAWQLLLDLLWRVRGRGPHKPLQVGGEGRRGQLPTVCEELNPLGAIQQTTVVLGVVIPSEAVSLMTLHHVDTIGSEKVKGVLGVIDT